MHMVSSTTNDSRCKLRLHNRSGKPHDANKHEGRYETLKKDHRMDIAAPPSDLTSRR